MYYVAKTQLPRGFYNTTEGIIMFAIDSLTIAGIAVAILITAGILRMCNHQGCRSH